MSNKPNTRRANRPASRPATRKGVPPRPSRANAGPSRGVVLGIVAAVIAAVAIIALVVSGLGDDSADAGPQTRPVHITGDALPERSGDADPAIGMTAPTLSGASFDGTPVEIANDGRPKLVMFLAHWCPHCRREVPVVVDWMRDNGAPEGVDLYAVATATQSDAPNYPPSKWLEREDWPITTLADDDRSSAGRALGVTGYPYFVAIDAEGRVVARTSGELPIAQLEALVDAARTPAPGGSSD